MVTMRILMLWREILWDLPMYILRILSRALMKALKALLLKYKDNPWLIGYFVANEPPGWVKRSVCVISFSMVKTGQ